MKMKSEGTIGLTRPGRSMHFSGGMTPVSVYKAMNGTGVATAQTARGSGCLTRLGSREMKHTEPQKG